MMDYELVSDSNLTNLGSGPTTSLVEPDESQCTPEMTKRFLQQALADGIIRPKTPKSP